jgi:hypothetical protein
VNADLPTLVENVEAAFQVERRAWAAGVPMPEPVVEPSSGHALARLDGGLFRVHRWVDGAYVRHSGVVVPAQPWVFAGWVAGQGGWLDDNATHRHDTARGRAEVRTTLGRLHRLATRMDALLAALY